MPAEHAYKVVETSVVTDEEIEQILNRMAEDGWLLDGMHFAMRDGSRRPSMAFLVFGRAVRAARADERA